MQVLQTKLFFMGGVKMVDYVSLALSCPIWKAKHFWKLQITGFWKVYDTFAALQKWKAFCETR